MHAKLRLILPHLILALIITIPATFALLNPFHFPTHDDQHIARLYLLDQGLRQGAFFPRWVDTLGFGFGYPLFNFYPPIIYYVAELFRIVGFSYIFAIKFMTITGFLLATLGMYLLAKKMMGRAAGILAATLYTYFTYHAVLVYVRGALAEFFAYALLPWVFLALYKLKDKPSIKHAIIFGITLALLILTHPLIALPTLFYLAIFIIFYFDIKLVKNTCIGLLLGLGLSAFFWLPSLVERKFTLVNQILTSELANYRLHFIYPQQLWYSSWGYGGSAEGLNDGLSYQLGKIHICLALLAFILSFVYLRFVKRDRLKHFYFFFILLLFSLIMTTTYSSFVWSIIPPLSYLQFPWRFLTFAAVFISLVGGFSIYFIAHIWERFNTKVILTVLALVSSFIVIFQYQKYFHPQQFIKTTDAARTSYEEIAWRISRTSYEFVPKGVATTKTVLGTTVVDIEKEEITKSPYKIISGSVDVTVAKNNFNEKIFSASAKNAVTFRLNTYNFPGWSAYVDKEKVTIGDNNKYKLITINISQGEHILEFRFEDTMARSIGNYISLISLLAVGFLLFGRRFVQLRKKD